MNFSGFIALRINSPERKSFSSVISIIAQGSVAIGVFILLISYSILYGFQGKIQDKLFSFSGHLQLTKYNLNTSLQEDPIAINNEFIKKCLADPNIANVNVYSLKAGLIKSKDEVVGCVVKGLDISFNQAYFKPNLISGRFIHFDTGSSGSKEVLISQKIALKLNVVLNDKILIYFVQDPPRYRNVQIVGIFESGMEEFDEAYILADINLLRRINNWDQNLAGGYEITVKSVSQLSQTTDFVYNNMDYDLSLEKISDKYATIFDWLNLLEVDMVIFLSLICVVAGLNMASSLFIMILERTNMIGTLKAFGAGNNLIIKIFFLNGIFLLLKGLLIGNVLAFAFCFIQSYFKLIPLDPQNYYMSAVPIHWSWLVWFLVNLCLFIFMSFVLLIPSLSILKITPIKAIKFD